LPDTDWTIQIEIDTVAEEIEIVAYHHDSPTGEFTGLPFSRRKKMIIRLKTPEGKIALRTVYLEQFGNFVMAKVRYKNEWYLLKEWDGDEYLRGLI